MDEKLDIRFETMQNATINTKLWKFGFLFEKEVKNLFYAVFSTESELCIPSED